MSLTVEISVESELWTAFAGLEVLVGATLQTAAENCGDPLLEGAEVSLLFCDDARIRELNQQFRDKDGPTNVLSFPGPDTVETAAFLGDIAIAYETVAREAQEDSISLEQHCRHMIVHGFLHLLGYDHEEDDEAEAMEALEINILRQMGVKNPYLADETEETEGNERVRPGQ